MNFDELIARVSAQTLVINEIVALLVERGVLTERGSNQLFERAQDKAANEGGRFAGAVGAEIREMQAEADTVIARVRDSEFPGEHPHHRRRKDEPE